MSESNISLIIFKKFVNSVNSEPDIIQTIIVAIPTKPCFISAHQIQSDE